MKADTVNEIDPLVRDTEVARLLDCSKATVWRRVVDGILPRPIKICGISRWPLSEIHAVIEKAKNERKA